MKKYVSGYSNYANLLLKQINPYYEVAIVGEEANLKAVEINQEYHPNKLLLGSIKESKLGLLQNKYIVGETMIYVCENKLCQFPTNNTREAIQLFK